MPDEWYQRAVTVAWQPSSVSATSRPSLRRGRLPWIGWGLVTAWSLLAALVAVYNVVTLDGQAIGNPSHFGVQARAGLQLLLVLVWLLSFNLAIAGLVMGVVSTVRRTSGRLWRAVALATAVILGGIAQVWGLTGGGVSDAGAASYASDVRLHSLATCLAALVVTGVAAALLGLRRQGDRP